MAVKQRNRESFLDNQGERQPAWLGSGNQKIVHRTKDGELANVTAGKKDRFNDIRVGCKRHSRASVAIAVVANDLVRAQTDFKHRLVFEFFEQRIA